MSKIFQYTDITQLELYITYQLDINFNRYEVRYSVNPNCYLSEFSDRTNV